MLVFIINPARNFNCLNCTKYINHGIESHKIQNYLYALHTEQFIRMSMVMNSNSIKFIKIVELKHYTGT